MLAMRVVAVSLTLGLSLVVSTPRGQADTSNNVIGGQNAPAGKYPDMAGIVFGSGDRAAVECTGVLVAPTVVLTAGHCNDPTLSAVIIGSHDLSIANAGQKIAVAKRLEYPNSQGSYDVTALVLAAPATNAPRAIASGWAKFEIFDGAKAIFAGYGALDKNSTTYVPQLQEATSTITDGACTHSAGCVAAAKPAGELGAGGMGIDTCPGDSGGPLYIDTPFGMFVAGLTSRAYDNAMFDCSEGGLYVRPDKIIDWIEEVTQVNVSRGPAPTAEAINIAGGEGGETRVVINDPKSTNHTFEVTQEPTRSRYAISPDGRIRVCADGAGAGTDALKINVVDADHIERSLPVTIKINVAAGTAATDCSLEFDASSGCGCQSDGNTGLGLLASVGVLGLLGRRRRA